MNSVLQMVRNFRKPLIVASPKKLLTLRSAVSSITEMTPGSTFSPVLTDKHVSDSSKVSRVAFVSGKHYYTLMEEREKRQVDDIAFVRLEVRH